MADPACQTLSDFAPLDEVTIRTEYALKIQKRIQQFAPGAEDFRLNNVHLAMICYAPPSAFREGGILADSMPALSVHQHLEALPPLLKHFLARWSDKAYTAYSKSHADIPAAPRTTIKATRGTTRESSAKALEKIHEQFQQLELGEPEEDEIEDDEDDIADMAFVLEEENRRNSSAITGCKRRDKNTCVLTGARDPEVCHIVPFSWNSTRTNIEKTKCVYHATALLMGVTWTEAKYALLANSDALGSSDHVWNTICMNPLLHKWWAQAFFGLKCLGIMPPVEGKSIVEVQFRWMPRSKRKPTAACSLTEENDMKKTVDEVRAFNDGGSLPVIPENGKIGASRLDLSCPLLSGHTFHVKMPPKDAERFKDMLDLQWVCIVIAALSGAAGYPHLLPDHPRWGDTDMRTLAWVEQQMLEGHAGQPPDS